MTTTEIEVAVAHPAISASSPAVMTVTALSRDGVGAAAPYTETIELTDVVAIEYGESAVPAERSTTPPAVAASGAGGAHLAELPVGTELALGDNVSLVEIGDGVFRVEGDST
jgi:hypothetical protein